MKTALRVALLGFCILSTSLSCGVRSASNVRDLSPPPPVPADVGKEDSTDQSAKIDPLIHDLSSKNPEMRKAACWALSALGPEAEKAIPHLVRCLNDPDDDVAHSAGVALRDIGAKAVPGVISALKHPKAKVRRRAAMYSAHRGTWEDDWLTPLLVQAMQNRSEDLRCEAMDALAHLGSLTGVHYRLLRQAAKDSCAAVRLKAVKWIWDSDLEHGRSILRALIGEDSPETSTRIAETLALKASRGYLEQIPIPDELGSETPIQKQKLDSRRCGDAAMELLFEMLENGGSHSREAAAERLRSLSSRLDFWIHLKPPCMPPFPGISEMRRNIQYRILQTIQSPDVEVCKASVKIIAGFGNHYPASARARYVVFLERMLLIPEDSVKVLAARGIVNFSCTGEEMGTLTDAGKGECPPFLTVHESSLLPRQGLDPGVMKRSA